MACSSSRQAASARLIGVGMASRGRGQPPREPAFQRLWGADSDQRERVVALMAGVENSWRHQRFRSCNADAEVELAPPSPLSPAGLHAACREPGRGTQLGLLNALPPPASHQRDASAECAARSRGLKTVESEKRHAPQRVWDGISGENRVKRAAAGEESRSCHRAGVVLRTLVASWRHEAVLMISR